MEACDRVGDQCGNGIGHVSEGNLTSSVVSVGNDDSLLLYHLFIQATQPGTGRLG